MAIDEIIIATKNAGKVREIREMFASHRLRFSSLGDHWETAPDIAETGSTFVENARMKAQWVFSRLGMWTMADDSGLEVDALGGEPGVRSARYAGEDASDARNNEKLLGKLADCPPARRTARFRCVIVLVGPGAEFVVEGACNGSIAFAPRGSRGFGYDPLFVPDGYELTFAELDGAVKHTISHRGRAIQSLRDAIHEYI